MEVESRNLNQPNPFYDLDMLFRSTTLTRAFLCTSPVRLTAVPGYEDLEHFGTWADPGTFKSLLLFLCCAKPILWLFSQFGEVFRNLSLETCTSSSKGFTFI